MVYRSLPNTNWTDPGKKKKVVKKPLTKTVICYRISQQVRSDIFYLHPQISVLALAYYKGIGAFERLKQPMMLKPFVGYIYYCNF